MPQLEDACLKLASPSQSMRGMALHHPGNRFASVRAMAHVLITHCLPAARSGLAHKH